MGFSFAGTCFFLFLFFWWYLLNGLIDQNEAWVQGVSECDLIFVIYCYNKKSKFQGLAIGL